MSHNPIVKLPQVVILKPGEEGDAILPYVMPVGPDGTARAVVSGEQQPNIGEPSGGVTVDSNAREAIDQIIAVLREFGLIASA